MNKNEILQAAETVVYERDVEECGSTQNDFEVIGDYWAVYLRNRCLDCDAELHIDAQDVANMLALVQLGKITTSNMLKAEHYVDACGYLACSGELATYKPKRLSRR